jgi:hypothetical protein
MATIAQNDEKMRQLLRESGYNLSNPSPAAPSP